MVASTMKRFIICFIFSWYIGLTNSDPANDTTVEQSPFLPLQSSELPVVKSIEDACKLFMIPLVNCSCEMFTMNGTNEFPDLCTMVKHMNKTVKKLIYSATLSRSYASVSVLASIVGIIGNIGVMLVAFKKRKTLPRCKFLIAQLAASDFIFAIIQFILVIPAFWTNQWIYGSFMCKVLRSGITLGSLISISLILLIGLERYLGILYPLQSILSGSIMNFISACVTLLAILSIIPSLVVYDVDSELGRCSEQWSNDDSAKYNWFLTIFYFILPVSMISYFYFRIIQYMRNQVDSNLIKDESGKQRRIKDNRRIMTILISVLVAFVLCILPNRIVWMYFDAVNYDVEKNTYMILSFIALIPYPIHVAVNPIIYSVVDKRWRADIIQVLTNPRKRTRSSATSNSTILSKDLIFKENRYGSTLHQGNEARVNGVVINHTSRLITYTPEITTDITKPVVDVQDDVFEN